MPSTFQCFRCGQFGHWYREFTNQAIVWPEGEYPGNKGNGKGKSKGKGSGNPRAHGKMGGRGQNVSQPNPGAIAAPAGRKISVIEDGDAPSSSCNFQK